MSISICGRMPSIMAVVASLIFVASCSRREDMDPERIMRFDRSIVSYSALDSVGRAAFRDTFRNVSDVMAKILTVGELSSASDSFLLEYSKSPKMLYYIPGIDDRLGSLDSVENMLGVAYGNMAHEFPAVKLPRIYGAVLTYNQSVVLADSIVIVGLNHYLGPDYEPYAYFNSYQRYWKQKRFVPYHITEAILSSAYPYRPSADATALSRMVYEGALVKAVLSVLESSDAASVLGYSPEQFDWAGQHERSIWNCMIERGLVYSTDQTVIDRLIKAAPSTSIVDPDAPGRLGRYTGMRIVESYLKGNPDARLTDLLDSAFYNSPQVLVRSNYYP
ncbi:MAG: hypothetical protein NC127_08960 [Muribaculum sp.]|nr:hypothetical protein [Muribaculum sp.]